MQKHPIAVFTGDNHLRPTTWLKHPTLTDDAYVSWRQIVDFCLQHTLPLILLGDLFDSTRPDSHSVGIYLHGIYRLEQASLPVYYIEGNHDRADPPWASLTPWAQPVGEFSIGGVSAYGVSFTNAVDLAARLATIPASTQLLLAHQSWLEIQRVGHTDGTFSMIPRGMTLLTGDYHVCGTYNGTAANGEPVIAHSPGATAMQALNEPASKYFGVLYSDLTVEWHQLETRTVVSMTLSNITDLTELVQWLPSSNPTTTVSVEIQKPILRVRYLDTIPDAFERITAVVGDSYHLFLEPQHQTTTQAIDVSAVVPTAFESLSSAIGELCTPGTPVHDTAYRLLSSPDIKQELESIFHEFTAS